MGAEPGAPDPLLEYPGGRRGTGAHGEPVKGLQGGAAELPHSWEAHWEGHAGNASLRSYRWKWTICSKWNWLNWAIRAEGHTGYLGQIIIFCTGSDTYLRDVW